MAKRFLFLDDDPKRHSAFSRMSVGCLVTHVWDVEQCELALTSEPPFDCVFLDHDLGGKTFVEETEGTGYEVVLFIRDSLPETQLPGAAVVHSWNPAGAERMCAVLRQTRVPVYRFPFSFPRPGPA